MSVITSKDASASAECTTSCGSTRMRAEKIKVGPHHYSLHFPRCIHADMRLGECDTDRLQICVRDDLPTSKLEEILLHECLHAMWTQAGLDDIGLDLEERVVSSLAPVLLQFINDNHDMVDELMATRDTAPQPAATDAEIARLREALQRIVNLDEADGHDLTWEHASQAVGIAAGALKGAS